MRQAVRGITILCILGYIFCGSYSKGADSVSFAGKPAVDSVHVDISRIDNLKTLDSLAREAQQRGEPFKVIEYARRMSDVAGDNDNMLARAYAFLGHSYIVLNVDDSVKLYLDKALSVAERNDNRPTMADIYNLMGIYTITTELDYYGGLTYFMEALELSDRTTNERQYLMILTNVATTYNYRNDPAGLEYALELYEYGVNNNEMYLVNMGAYIASSSYVLMKDYHKALEYMEIAISMVDTYGRHTSVYSSYADILLALGNKKRAEEYYRMALDYAGEGETLSVTLACLNYGKFLLAEKRYREAIEIFSTGIRLSVDKKTPVHRYELYEGLSEAYAQTGDYHMALDSYMLYHNEADSVFNVERERSINQLRIKYEAEKKEREIQENKLVILKERKKFQISVIVIAFFAIALGVTYAYFAKKKKNYMRVIRQHQDTINKERWYRQSLAEISYNAAAPNQAAVSEQSKYSLSSLSDEKSRRLFADLEELMRTQQIYKRKDLSREKVAEMLFTNRTYLSQVINEHTGLSFNYYIHSFRINEATRILSDPENDTPLKALSDEMGFSAISTFYKLFQSAIGVTPSKFRETVKSKKGCEDNAA